MLDPHIRHLLDTVFQVPPGTVQHDVAALRKAAEEAPGLLGGAPEMLASVSDATMRVSATLKMGGASTITMS